MSGSVFAKTTVRMIEAMIPTLPVRKIRSKPILRPMETLRSMTSFIGRNNTATSVTIFGTLLLYANARTSKHLPPGIDLSQLYANGMHWKQAATVNESQVPNMAPTSVQAAKRSHLFVKTRR